jgi:hypothetical protein
MLTVCQWWVTRSLLLKYRERLQCVKVCSFFLWKVFTNLKSMDSNRANMWNVRIIKSLRTKNTCGYYEISNQIIKLSAPFVISPLTYICNAVLSTGVFPDRLKYALVKLIFKKGNKQEISNFKCCPSVHVDNYTIIVPTKCTSFY